MAGKFAANSSRGRDADTQTQTLEVLSPKTTTACLLSVEGSLSEMHLGIDSIQTILRDMTRQLEQITNIPPPQPMIGRAEA